MPFCRHSIFKVLFTIIFLFSMVPKGASASSMSFSFDRFDQSLAEIFLEGDANVESGKILVTFSLRPGQNHSFGRATYAKPLRLWDEASGGLTNFTTHFSFLISRMATKTCADGLTFFLAPNGSRIPPNVESGGGLGLVEHDAEAVMPDLNHFVAVEFDTFWNPWDPPGTHVGVDVNSMISVSNESWQGDLEGSHVTNVWIAYDSSRKNLSVIYTNIIDNNSTVLREISAAINLADYLPEWVTFGFSASTARQAFEINAIEAWEFNSTSDFDESQSSSGISGMKLAMIPVLVGLTIVSCAFVVGILFVWLALRKRMRKCKKSADPVPNMCIGEEFKNGTASMKFCYDELAGATNDFSEGEKLGEGSFGAVYRGFLKDLNCQIAVKRLSRDSKQGLKEFVSEAKIISRLRHRNLVKLIGWCQEKELLLAYEYLPQGSLDSHLFKEKSLLPWTLRYKIAQDLSCAMLYLHEEGDQCVLHRDIKPSNIMLDSDFNAKLGDFGLARLVDHAKGWQTTMLAGTVGYIAPECFKSGKATKESDIYSFGIVILQIACGRRVFESWREEDQVTTVEWVWKLHGVGKHVEAVDQKLSGVFDTAQVKRLMVVGLWCVHPNPSFRPTIRQVANVLLNVEAPLPVIPSEMPILAYLAPPSKPSSFYWLSSGGSALNSANNAHN